MRLPIPWPTHRQTGVNPIGERFDARLLRATIGCSPMKTPLSDALAERGYDTLTDVQTAVTDPELAQTDLLVSAQTGSGKTVGFGLAIAETLLGEADTFAPAAAPLALVIAPTRELAIQGRTRIAVALCQDRRESRDLYRRYGRPQRTPRP